MELDEVKDAYRALESGLSRDEQQYKQKAQMLERSLDSLNQMYQTVVSERSALKIDVSVAEKKVARKDEKIVLLEKQLASSKEKVRLKMRMSNDCGVCDIEQEV